MRGRDVYVFVFDGVADWESAFAIAGINNPQFQRVPGRYRVVTVGCSIHPVTTMGGMRILPDISVAEIEINRAAMLILPGGGLWTDDNCAHILDVGRRFRIRGIPVAAISEATLALARAGMLDDFHHTSNSREYLAATGYHGVAFYCDVPAIADEGLITASGFASVGFAREIFRELGLYAQPSLDAWYALLRFGDASRYSDVLTCASR
ncbi:DJ-1/PfpI family protein [Telmatobacter sp. DSM 110680]|uniref:DJ-1/PfpI family protein n=1 Tax=Telmatobacter sp. DSM 110680 TaxID=3036704 RepID=A0AAU7DC90_9BACT